MEVIIYLHAIGNEYIHNNIPRNDGESTIWKQWGHEKIVMILGCDEYQKV